MTKLNDFNVYFLIEGLPQNVNLWKKQLPTKLGGPGSQSVGVTTKTEDRLPVREKHEMQNRSKGGDCKA